MNPTRTRKFQCGECRKLHEWEDDAEACCAPRAHEVNCFECSECHVSHIDEDEARYCCLDEDIVLPATPMQLEAAGQQRLPI